MTWFGKVLGGTLGLVTGGPVGAVVGVALGQRFDKSPRRYRIRHYRGPLGRFLAKKNAEEQVQERFLECAFSMLAKLARADGAITREEIEVVDFFIKHLLVLNPKRQEFAQNIFRVSKDSKTSFHHYALAYYEMFHGFPHMLDIMLDMLFRVAIADGVLQQSEEEKVHEAAHIFGIDEAHYNQLRSTYVEEMERPTSAAPNSPSAIRNYYTVLGCKPDDSVETIKKQYRKLVSVYHPDKIAGKGLPEEFEQYAHEKFREIQEAYDEFKRDKGVS